MTYDLIINNGKVVLTEEVIDASIAVKDGKIAAIGYGLLDAKETIDAAGMMVLPGVVDAHVHLCEPGRTEWEGFETGTKALAAGGTTCYVDMPLNNLPATIDKETAQIKLKSAEGKNYVDYALYGGLVPHNLTALEELDEVGVVGYKGFMSTCGFGVPGDFKNVDDYELYQGMRTLAKLGQTLSLHCENAVICDRLGEDAQAAGKTDMESYLDSRPIFTEVEAVKRALYLGKVTGCKLHFVHLSSAEAIETVLEARRQGQEVTIESCPHYLNLTREDCVRLGALGKCSPPIRSKEEAQLLWKEFMAGHIDILTSDHSPCPPSMKETNGDLFKAWGGLSACQNVLDIMFDEAVQKRNIPVEFLMQTLAYRPAKIFGLGGKGEIAVGKDADIVILAPNTPYVLQAEDLYYRHKHSAYVGRKIGCQVQKTFVRGNLVFERQRGIVGKALGKFIKKEKI